jgi:thiamine transport system substrate-binding protein
MTLTRTSSRPVRPAVGRRSGPLRTAAVLAGAALALSACSLGDTGAEDAEPSAEASGDAPAESGPVTLLTHESFELPDRLLERFEEETGRTLRVRSSGDAGEMTTRLSLTAGDPTGDVAFGVDNTFASRALEAGVFAEHGVEPPDGADEFALPAGGDRLVPVDHASVCVNVDDAWFDREGMEPPEGLADLTDPEYRGLLVVPGATTSSPGLAFLLATVAEYGEDWPAYWEDLMANDTRLVKGWSDAYYVDFTFSGGDRPLVLSYDSSPAFTLTEDGEDSTTSALLDTCFRQVEYAGVLEGTENPEGARQVLDLLLSPDVQAALPTNMYVFPVREGVALPEDWAGFAEQPEDPATLDPAEIAENREQWLTEWTDVTTR